MHVDQFQSYRDLRVWKEAMDLAVDCYELTKGFPREEVYGLTSQIRHAAASVAANIAEGHGRETTASFIHFLRTAQGLLKELETHVTLAKRVGIASEISTDGVMARCDGVGRMLRALVRSLQQKLEAKG
jgi:four helix bundle protein